MTQNKKGIIIDELVLYEGSQTIEPSTKLFCLLDFRINQFLKENRKAPKFIKFVNENNIYSIIQGLNNILNYKGIPLIYEI